MKKIALALSVLFGCAAVAPAQENILKNGIVDGVTEWLMAGVNTSEENNYVKEKIYTYDAEVSHSEDWSGSLKISGIDCADGFKPWQAWRHRDIVVEPGATYRVSVWVKTENVPVNANLYLGFGFKDSAGRWLTGWVPGHPEKNSIDHRTSAWIDTVKGTHDWMELSGTVTAPSDAVMISYLQARIDNIISAPEATVWFDDFSIVKE